MNNDKGIGIQISDQMVSGGDYRYANHHHDPSAVTDVEGVLPTLDRTTHKALIQRLYGKVSRDKEEVYV